MNNQFAWSRFFQLVKKDFSSIWQNAGVTLLIIVLLPVAVWSVWLAVSWLREVPPIAPEIRWVFIFGVAVLAAIVTPSRLYRTCNLPKEGKYYAMLPASKLEKYVSMLLFSILICPLLCLVGSMVVDYFLTLLPFGPYDKWLWQTDYLATLLDYYRAATSDAVTTAEWYTDEVGKILALATPGRVILLLMVEYLMMISLFVFTNTIFRKLKVLQTILWRWLILFVLNIIVTPLFGLAIVKGDFVERYFEAGSIQSLNILYWAEIFFSVVFFTVFFWWTSHRLKKMRY